MNRKNRSAFTFIELLIAVTIFCIIAVSVYSVFNAGIRVGIVKKGNMTPHQGCVLNMNSSLWLFSFCAKEIMLLIIGGIIL